MLEYPVWWEIEGPISHVVAQYMQPRARKIENLVSRHPNSAPSTIIEAHQICSRVNLVLRLPSFGNNTSSMFHQLATLLTGFSAQNPLAIFESNSRFFPHSTFGRLGGDKIV